MPNLLMCTPCEKFVIDYHIHEHKKILYKTINDTKTSLSAFYEYSVDLN